MACRQTLDGIEFAMREPFDFGFLRRYGRAFRVFDDQDSGNICFGVEGERGRLFVKFAGAPTARGSVSIDTAVDNLRATVPLYTSLRHDCLTELLEAHEEGGGYAMVFRWAEGECMGRQYPDSHARFMALPVVDKLHAFCDVQRFLAHTAACGYVAIDFYDGSIMYDAASGRTTICDIDFFRAQPAVNDMGRMWGSSRFMSPEEYELGAALDEVTNVYTLGATALSMFTDSAWERGQWPLGDATYAIVMRAVSAERGARQHSIAQFADEWRTALAADGM